MKDLYDILWEHIFARYPDAVPDMYYPGKELLFYPNRGAFNRMETWTCYIGKNGTIVIESEF